MFGGKRLVTNLASMLALVLLAGPVAAQKGKAVAVVNDDAIYDVELTAILKTIPPSPTPLTAAQRKEMQRDALDFLINDRLMKGFLKKQFKGKTLDANSRMVNLRVKELEDALKKKGQTLAQFLKAGGQTEKDLRQGIVKDIQWETYAQRQLTDSVVKSYFEAYRPFFDKVMVRASHILVKVPDKSTAADRAAARKSLAVLRREIIAKRISFAEAVKKYSDCPSKKTNGDIGFFQRKFAVLEPFAQAAFSQRIGEISNVVETDYGLHLIMVTNRTKGEKADFAKIKDDVRKICMAEMYMRVLSHERDRARIKVHLP